MKDKALKLAIDALKDFDYDKRLAAIKVCEEALAKQALIQRAEEAFAASQQQEQGEPVAWMRNDGQRVTTARDRRNYPDYETRYPIPLYTTLQPKQEQGEPVAWALFKHGRLESFWMDKGDAYDYEFTSEHELKPLYTTPQQHKPLEMAKQMKERCDNMEMRGAFVDGWTSAETAHNNKE